MNVPGEVVRKVRTETFPPLPVIILLEKLNFLRGEELEIQSAEGIGVSS